MKNSIILFLLLVFPGTHIAQQLAKIDGGKQVLLYDDGTWEYFNVPINEVPSSTYIFMDTERLKAGIAEIVYEDYNLKTSIQLAKKGNQTIIIFWQEGGFNNHYSHWTGSVILYLNNGETIKLMDRNLKGKNIIENGLEADKNLYGYSLKQDLYQWYHAYHLTPTECQKLQKSDIVTISYNTNPYNNGERRNIRISSNANTCKTQLRALK